MIRGRPAMRWWGWGTDQAAAASSLGASGRRLLVDELDIDGGTTAHPPLRCVRIPEPRLPPALLHHLQRRLGGEHVHQDHRSRVSHAVGRSYLDLMALRGGQPLPAPDAVAEPGSPEEVAAVLAACVAHGVAVVPFGGGTSVVGGVNPDAGGRPAVLCLDLSRLDALLGVDPHSLLATVGAGMSGPQLETGLAAHGLTLGHLPQSFEFATIGGFAATRSAGQASGGYGRFDDMVAGVRMATPAGELRTLAHPGSAAGPDLRRWVLGSEGAFGVITEVTLHVRRRPSIHRYEGWSFPSFEAGVEAMRSLAQGRALADVTRLSDPAETRMGFALTGRGSGAERALHAYRRARGHEQGCLAVTGFEGDDAAEVSWRRRRAHGRLRAQAGVRLGSGVGRAWRRGRFHTPYLRDELIDRGVLVETLETATTWTGLLGLHAAVRRALREALEAEGTPPLIGCHLSHLYPSGASLYVTVIARCRRDDPLGQWRRAKAAATDAILGAGGTLTHHHAVGRDHAPWLSAEIGDLGVAALRGVKDVLDPTGIMNPGTLLASPRPSAD